MFHLRNKIDSLGSTFTPAVLCPCILTEKENNQLRTFWSKPISYFGFLSLTKLMVIHLLNPAIQASSLTAL